MNALHLILAIALASVAVAQERSGRTWHRTSRLVPTQNAAPVVDAGHATQRVQPLRRLRTGRAWPHHHFRRLPVTEPKASAQAVDASARTTSPRRRGFWRPRLR